MVRITKKPEERREEIVEAARVLFLHKGYDSTTMKDIMTHLGIAKGTIYHYFASKEELLEAVLDFMVAGMLNKMHILLQSSTGDALSRMRFFIERSASDDHDPEVIERLHQPGNTGMHLRLLAKMITNQAPLYAALIKQGCDEGIFRTDTPLESAEFLLAASQFLTDLGIYPWPQPVLLRRINALPALLEAQLAARPGSFDFIKELLGTRRINPN